MSSPSHVRNEAPADERIDAGDDREYRRFLTGFVVTTVALLGAIGGFNHVMDPYSASRNPWFPGVHEFGTTRIGKGELLHKYPGSTVYIGNSRAMLGIRSASARLAEEACNVGVAAASFGEILEILRTALDKPDVRRILVFVDFEMFKDDYGFRESFTMSRFHGSKSELEHGFDLLWNYHTLFDAYDKLRYMRKGKAPEYSEFGCPIPERMTAKELPQPRYRTILGNAFRDGKCSRPFQYDPRTVEDLRPFLRQAGDRSVELVLVVNPLHATQFETVWKSGSWPIYRQWARDLTRVVDEETRGGVAIWDFAGHNAYTTEPLVLADGTSAGELRWFWEPSHYRCELGDLMLRRIAGDVTADSSFGERLTMANVETRLSAIDAAHDRWAASHPRDLALIGAISGDRPTGLTEAPLRMAVEPNAPATR